MTRLESQKVDIAKPSAEVFAFLSDFNNYQRLMPDQVKNWTSTADTCSFTLSGMATLGMKIAGKTPHSEIKIIRDGKAPFDFDLTCVITDQPGGCSLQIVLNADMNPFIKMMAEKPLTNFLNLLAGKAKEI